MKLQESSKDTVFVVGRGTAAGARRNALRIDSNNNSNFTGSVNVSGSLTLNGVTVVDGNRNGLITTGSIGGTQSITGSLNIVSGSLRITGNTVNIVSGTLSLQSSGLNTNNNITITSGGLNLLASNIGTNGKITFNGSDNFTGSVPTFTFVGQITPEILAVGNVVGSSPTSGSNLWVYNNNSNQAGFQLNAQWNNTNANIDIFNTNGNRQVQINSDTTIINSSLAVTGSLGVTGDVQFASGSNKTMGTAVLDGGNPGTVTVSNTLVTANSLIFLTKQTLSNAHMVAVTSKGSSTFTITSNGNGDADTVAYLIINPS